MDLLEPGLLVEDLLGVGIERRERADRAQEHAHRVRVVLEPFHQLLDVLVKHRVQGDLPRPLLQLRPGRQLAEQNQVRRFEVRRLLRQLLDRIPAVHQDPAVSVDVRDLAATGGRVHERRIVGHQAAVFGPRFDLAQVRGADGAVGDGDLVLFSRAVVGDGQRVGHNSVRSARLGHHRHRNPVPGRRKPGTGHPPIGPGPRSGTVRCRTGASAGPRDAPGTGRIARPRPSGLF
jgi:hypothetical protein